MPENKTDNAAMLELIDRFGETTQDNPELDPVKVEEIASALTSREELEAGLPDLLELSEGLKANAATCDTNIKEWQESKRQWKRKSDSLALVMYRLITRLGLPPKGIKVGDIKLSTATRTSLEVDEDWLIGMYQPLADVFQKSLPPYIKVSISVGKKELSDYLKTDNSLMVDNPERIHTKPGRSTTITRKAEKD